MVGLHNSSVPPRMEESSEHAQHCSALAVVANGVSPLVLESKQLCPLATLYPPVARNERSKKRAERLLEKETACASFCATSIRSAETDARSYLLGRKHCDKVTMQAPAAAKFTGSKLLVFSYALGEEFKDAKGEAVKIHPVNKEQHGDMILCVARVSKVRVGCFVAEEGEGWKRLSPAGKSFVAAVAACMQEQQLARKDAGVQVTVAHNSSLYRIVGERADDLVKWRFEPGQHVESKRKPDTRVIDIEPKSGTPPLSASSHLKVFTDEQLRAHEAWLQQVFRALDEGKFDALPAGVDKDETASTQAASAEHGAKRSRKSPAGTGRTKLFFGYAYEYGPQRDAGDQLFEPSAGVSAATWPIPEHITKNVLPRLAEVGAIPGVDWVTAVAVNRYAPNSRGLGAHVDSPSRFERPIVSLRLLSDARLTYGPDGQGATSPEFRLPHPRNTVLVLHAGGYAADGTTHAVRSDDLTGDESASLIARRFCEAPATAAEQLLLDAAQKRPAWQLLSGVSGMTKSDAARYALGMSGLPRTREELDAMCPAMRIIRPSDFEAVVAAILPRCQAPQQAAPAAAMPSHNESYVVPYEEARRSTSSTPVAETVQSALAGLHHASFLGDLFTVMAEHDDNDQLFGKACRNLVQQHYGVDAQYDYVQPQARCGGCGDESPFLDLRLVLPGYSRRCGDLKQQALLQLARNYDVKLLCFKCSKESRKRQVVDI